MQQLIFQQVKMLHQQNDFELSITSTKYLIKHKHI